MKIQVIIIDDDGKVLKSDYDLPRYELEKSSYPAQVFCNILYTITDSLTKKIFGDKT